MEQQEINYSDIMSLGFTEEYHSDNVYEKQYGFPYAIITKNLTDLIYLNWDKVSRVAEMVRINKDHDIMAKMPIKDLDHLKEINSFFCDDKKNGIYKTY